MRHTISLAFLLAFMAPQWAGAEDDFFWNENDAIIAYRKGMTVRVPPHDFVEACLTLGPGSHRRYAFATPEPLDFNVHYHDPAGIFYLTEAKDVQNEAGLITTKHANVYCWMWENKEPARVELTFRIWAALE